MSSKIFLGLTNSEFNSIHFGVEIKKKKFNEFQKFFGSNKFRILFYTIWCRNQKKKEFYEFQKFLGLKYLRKKTFLRNFKFFRPQKFRHS